MRPECPICGSKHFVREPHVFKDEVKPLHEVLRVASNAASNGGKSASNAGTGSKGVVKEVGGGVQAGKDVAAPVNGKAASKQRWAKAKYNAYQRNLMAIRRQTPKAIAEGRADVIR